MRLLRQRQRREPLQDRGAGVGARDGGRDPHRLDGGHGAVLGVAARAAHPDDAVARVQAWRGGGDDAAGGFFAEDFGLGGRVEAGAEVAARVGNEGVSECVYICACVVMVELMFQFESGERKEAGRIHVSM